MTTHKINSASIEEVKCKIAKLRQGTSKVHVYYDALKKLWNELSSFQVSDIENDERVNQFLMGIHESYSNIRDKILATEPLPSIESVFSMIESEETAKFLELCKKNAAEYMGDRRRNPYVDSSSLSSRDRLRDYDFGSRYRGLFAPGYGSSGFSFI